MSQAPTVQQLLAALAKWKVPFTGLDGWETHNREGHGAWGDMHGFVNHHSASSADGQSYAEGTLYQGRSDLPGPLCNFGLDRSGMVWGIGWGRANHAGSSRPEFLAALLRDQVPPRPISTLGETDDANSFTYGVEAMNNGLGEEYAPDQIESLVRLNCALLDFHGWNENSSVQHYEVTRRKVDMSDIMGQEAGPFLRNEVKHALLVGPDGYHFPGSTRWAPVTGPGASAPVPTQAPAPLPEPAPVIVSKPAPPTSSHPLPGVPVKKIGFPGANAFGPGRHGDHILALGSALVLAGFGGNYSSGPSRDWGEADRRATAAFQRSKPELASDADGIPGPLTWHLLGLD